MLTLFCQPTLNCCYARLLVDLKLTQDIIYRPLWFPLHFVVTQLRPLPEPKTDYTGKTVIVTGANVGLGKEAACHFCRLGARKVVLACRDLEKGRVARAEIEALTSKKGVVDVWQVDLASFQSVKDFCHRADTELERLDVVIENAGVAIGTYVEADGGFESTIAINVVSTFLMALLLLPLMRRTAMRFNVEPRLVIVSSDAHMFVSHSLGTSLRLPCMCGGESTVLLVGSREPMTDRSRPSLRKGTSPQSLTRLKARKT